MLNKQGAGYEVKEKNEVTHLFYMGDLKLFSRDEAKLQQPLSKHLAMTNNRIFLYVFCKYIVI